MKPNTDIERGPHRPERARRRPVTGAAGKAAQTHKAIVECALRMASASGLGALTLGTVADEMRMSKTGVFARVGSIEALQLDVLAAYRAHFRRHVVDPANATPAGLPRLRAMFGFWARLVGAQACLYLNCASEFDDRPGPLRDAVLAAALDWRHALETCIRHAVDAGQLDAATDPGQLACEMAGLVLVLQHHGRLLGATDGLERSMRAFERLLAACRAAPAERAPALPAARAARPESHAPRAVFASLIGR